jgi:hypothetical protein
MRIKDTGKGGCVFRFHDVFNYYFINVHKEGVEVGKFVNG